MQSAVSPRPRFTHVIFDFDGTVSWLRHGWPEIMVSMFLEHVAAARRSPDDPALRERLLDDILSLNGKPSIHQMVSFTERLREWGGNPPDPQALLQDYDRRLTREIDYRLQRVRSGAAAPDEFLVFGIRPFLEVLAARGTRLFILSGTAEPFVRNEAALLGVSGFFDDRIHGSPLDGSPFSKQAVIERILREEQVEPERLLSFGDGPVEIHFTKVAGGHAVGVASDENNNGSGRRDPAKERQLAAAGADRLIADYRDPELLAQSLFGA